MLHLLEFFAIIGNLKEHDSRLDYYPQHNSVITKKSNSNDRRVSTMKLQFLTGKLVVAVGPQYFRAAKS